MALSRIHGLPVLERRPLLVAAGSFILLVSMVVTITPAFAVPGTVSFSSSESTAPEGTSPHTIEIGLDVGGGASDGPVTVGIAVTGGTATSEDFTLTTTEVSFPDASPDDTRPVSLSIADDALDEADETIVLEISVTSGTATLGSVSTHTVTITDDDPLPSVSIEDAAAVAEGGTAEFTVNLSAVSGRDVTVPWATVGGTATSGDDFVADSDDLTIPAGSSSGTISVVTTDDALDEEDELFNVQLSNPVLNGTLGTSEGAGTITDNDPAPIISVDPDTAQEGSDITFRTSLSSASGLQVTASYRTQDGTAVAPDDYTSIPSPTPIVFAPGETEKFVTISTVDDSDKEPTEIFTLELANPSNAAFDDTLGIGTGTILDDDGPPGLSIIDAQVSEGDGFAVFTVALLPGVLDKSVKVDYATVAGTAAAGSGGSGDFTTTVGTLTFTKNGDTFIDVPVPIVDDDIDEIAETFTMVLLNEENAAIVDGIATGRILDDDNVAPEFNTDVRTVDASGDATLLFGRGDLVTLVGSFTDPGVADTHTVKVDWGDGSAAESLDIDPTGTTDRAFESTHRYAAEGLKVITVVVGDADGASSVTKALSVLISAAPLADAHTTGLVDPSQGLWHVYDGVGQLVSQFYFGNPGDYPIFGDWDCDGVETPGMFRQSDGYVYLRNSNTQGAGEIRFFFGNPGDVPIAGDFDGDGCDTVSIYRPSNQTFYIINELGANDGGLGAAEFSYVFGDPGDKPFVGDFDGDGVETVGLHRESTGLVYFRNSHTQGNADADFIFGDPGDRLIAGDWNGNGVFSPGVFRPSDVTMYLRYSNSQGNADNDFVPVPVGSSWLPISGQTG